MKQLLKRFDQDQTAGYFFTLPFTIGFLAFLIIPMGISLYYAFCDYNILSPAEFTGIKNFIDIFQDKTFYQSLAVTTLFAVASVPLKLLFALIIALLMQRTSKLSAVYRAVYYLPSIIGGSVAVAILWKRMFASDGVINKLLGAIGIETHFSWLGDTRTAIWVLVLLTVWQFGSSMLIFLSALKQVPTSLYEAAMVDGAGPVRRFFKITLPLLTSTIFFNLVMQMINGFLAFTQCYIITEGKPMNSTLLYTVYTYQQSFEFYHTGYAAALAWIMVVVICLVTAVLFATKKFWVYEGGL